MNTEINETAAPIETYADITEKARKADVTGGNAATPWARATFAKMAEQDESGGFPFTYKLMVATVCAVYSHTNNTGKAGGTVGSLKDCGKPGYSAMSARLTTVKRILDEVAVDGVKPLLEAFVASDKASDSFAMLDKNVREAVKQAAKALANSPAILAAKAEAAIEAELKAEAEAEAEIEARSVASQIAAITRWFADMPDSEAVDLAGNEPALIALSMAISNATAKGAALLEAMTAPAMQQAA